MRYKIMCTSILKDRVKMYISYLVNIALEESLEINLMFPIADIHW